MICLLYTSDAADEGLGVDICGTSYSDIDGSGFHCGINFPDNIVFFPPKRKSLLRLDTEFTSSLETDATLIQFNFVSEWAMRSIWRQ